MKKRLIQLLATLCCLTLLLSGCEQVTETTAADTTVETSTAVEAIEKITYTYADTIAWDGEYEVIVIGYGGAGANAAIAAADAGASVLITEKAPKGEEGGNTRFSGQFTLVSYDYEQTLTYLKNLAGGREYDEEILKAFAQGMTEIKDYYENTLGAQGNLAGDISPGYASAAREFKEYEGYESVDWYLTSFTGNDASAWNMYKDNIEKRADNIDVWYRSPALHLIQDPSTKTILGVQIDKEGTLVNIRATNGVVMACGGFENNAEYVEYYLGLSNMMPAGTIYNTGDGIAMALEVGANLWHMSNWATSGTMMNYCIDTNGEEEHAPYIVDTNFGSGAAILVGKDGTRFGNENPFTRHGKTQVGGEWILETRPSTAYFVCDDAKYQQLVSSGLLKERHTKYFIQADSIEELATLIGTTNLANTISSFNSYAAEGVDPEHGRSAESMTAFSASGPYHAVKMQPYFLNTQGGAERNEKAEVIGIDGDPIPHLYSAGEFGSITVNDYNGGGNIAECVVFGRIAGTNAAAPKDPLPEYTVDEPVESNIVYTLNSDDGSDQMSYEVGENQYIGIGTGGMGGDIVVRVTYVDGAITAIEVLEHNETPAISDPAFATIPDAIIAAQSTEVDTCSGCTLSSKVLIAAVQDALAQAQAQ